jgi:hypothetical protein
VLGFGGVLPLPELPVSTLSAVNPDAQRAELLHQVEKLPIRFEVEVEKLAQVELVWEWAVVNVWLVLRLSIDTFDSQELMEYPSIVLK